MKYFMFAFAMSCAILMSFLSVEMFVYIKKNSNKNEEEIRKYISYKSDLFKLLLYMTWICIFIYVVNMIFHFL